MKTAHDDALPALIVSAECAPAEQSYFEDARQRYFPRERNFIPAHMSLFHALPGGERRRIAEDIEDALQAYKHIPLIVAAPRSIGNGIAFFLESPELQQYRADLAKRWQQWLTPQDRQGYRPHITVQNKVDRSTLEQSLAALRADTYPRKSEVTAISLWQYEDGPWKHLATFITLRT